MTDQRVRQWIEVLREPDAEMSKIACDKLGDIGSKDAVPDLIAAMQKRTALVAAAAAKALGRLDDKRAASALIQTLTTHHDILVQTTAAESLGLLKASEAVETLKTLVEDYIQRNRHDHWTMTRSQQRGLFIACLDALKVIGTKDALRFVTKVTTSATERPTSY